MYRKVLVPLDGSPLAECVLPHVEAIARGCQTRTVVFVRAIESAVVPIAVAESGSVEAWKALEEKNKAEAESYLGRLVRGLSYDGVEVKWELLPPGRPADMIVEYATANGVDLIIMATHGRSGISRWVMGSTADRVLRSACFPVLMVRAPGCGPGP